MVPEDRLGGVSGARSALQGTGALNKEPLPEPLPPVPSQPVGWTPGSFAVNQAGEATYTVPIAVPPGPAGLEPHLALVYRSQAGEGLAGQSWDVAGLSIIRRQGRDLAHDGLVRPLSWDGEDAFALDGERLHLVSGPNGRDGAVYQTNPDRFLRIECHGDGPDAFSVHTADGRVMTYGEYPSTSSAVNSPIVTGFGGVPAAWALSEVRDKSRGWVIRYRYRNERGYDFVGQPTSTSGVSVLRETHRSTTAPTLELLPDLVVYGGGGGNEGRRWIRFGYGARPRGMSGYRRGHPFRRTALLRNVVAGASPEGAEAGRGLPERTYELTFLHELEGDAREGWHPSEPPLLARITESDRNGTKKIPTRFRWTRGGQGFSRLEPGASLGSALSDEELEQVGEGLLVGTGSHVGDFDNDGRQEGFSCRQPVARYGEEEEGLELGYLEVHRQGGQWWWSRDREEGERGAPREYGCCPWHIDALDREWKDLDHNGFTDPGHGSPLEDVDGDGFLDLVYLTGEDAKWKHSSRDEDWRNWGTCAGVGIFEFESFLSGSERSRTREKVAAELDDCGFPLFCIGKEDGTDVFGLRTSLHHVDLNGDGHRDLLAQQEARVCDFEDHWPRDGITTSGCRYRRHWKYRLHLGDGSDGEDLFGETQDLNRKLGISYRYRAQDVPALIMDYDGDGAIDLLLGDDGRRTYLAIMFVGGDDGLHWEDTQVPTRKGSIPTITLDANGDGLVDVLKVEADGQGCLTGGSLWVNRGWRRTSLLGGPSGVPAFGSSLDLGQCYRWDAAEDADGDGQSELFVSGGDGTTLRLVYSHSSHGAFEVDGEATDEERVPCAHPMWIDLNADYAADASCGRPDGTFLNNRTPSLITGIRDGRILEETDGQWTVQVQYAPTTDEEVYQNEAHDKAPERVVVPAMTVRPPKTYVVASYTADQGEGTTPLRYSYRYFDSRFDRYWGWLGFGQVEEQQSVQGDDDYTAPLVLQRTLSVYDNYRRRQWPNPEPGGWSFGVYPFKGLLLHSTTTRPAGSEGGAYRTVQRRQFETQSTTRGTFFVYQAENEEQTDLVTETGGVNRLHHAFWGVEQGSDWRPGVDDFGNILRTRQWTGDGPDRHELVTTVDYDNDEDQWLLRRPHHIERQWISPDDDPAEVVVDINYVPGKTLVEWVSQGANQERRRTYSYDEHGNVETVFVRGRNGDDELVEWQEAEFVYDAEGIHVVEEFNALGHQRRYRYSSMGQLLLAEDQNGLVTRFERDGFDRLVAVEDYQTRQRRQLQMGLVTFDGNSWFAQTYSTPDGNRLEVAYDRSGQPRRKVTVDPLGRDVYWFIDVDERGRPSKVFAPTLSAERPEAYWQYEYGDLDRVRRVTNTNGAETKITPLGHRVVVSEILARPAPGVSAEGTVVYEYDTARRLSSVIDQAHHEWHYRYGPWGQLKQVTDPYNRSTWFLRDDLGRLEGQIDPVRGSQSYEYDDFDRLTATTDGRGCRVELDYDELDRVVDRIASGGGCDEHQAYGYDEGGSSGVGYLAWARSLPDGPRVSYSYERQGRLLGRTLAVPAGRASPTGGASYQYFTHRYELDDMYRLARHEYPAISMPKTNRGTYPKSTGYPAVSYPGQNKQGALTLVPDGVNPQEGGGGIEQTGFGYSFVVRYDYNEYGALNLISDDLDPSRVWQEVLDWDMTGRPTQLQTHGCVESKLDYDQLTGSLKSIESDTVCEAPRRPLQDLHYGYWLNGLLKERRNALASRAELFGYDRLKRLNTILRYGEDDDGEWRKLHTTRLDYDDVGNLEWKSDVGDWVYDREGSHPYAVSELVTTEGERLSYDYDGAGQMRYRQGQELAYTSFGKPTTIEGEAPDEWLELVYDGELNRVLKLGSNGQRLYVGAYEQDQDGLLTRHRYQIGPITIERTIQPTITGNAAVDQVRQVLTDNLGSADVVVDERGDTLDRLCFDAFGGPRAPPWSGEPRSVGPWSFGFAGHEHDEELGLINMGGREYDPELGRFLTPDPIIQFPSFGQSFNGYSYALNSPLTFTDSSGYFVDALVSAVISFASGLLNRWSGGDTQGDPNWDGPAYGGGCANCQGGSGGGGRESRYIRPAPPREPEPAHPVTAYSLAGRRDTAMTAQQVWVGTPETALGSPYSPLGPALTTPAAGKTFSDSLIDRVVRGLGAHLVDRSLPPVLGSYYRVPSQTGAPYGVLGGMPGWMAVGRSSQRLGYRGHQAGAAAAFWYERQADVAFFAVEAEAGVLMGGVGALSRGAVRAGAAAGVAGGRFGSYGQLRRAGVRDAHHIIQDAAVRDLPGYSRSAAPAVELPGPSIRVGSPHYAATQAQRQAGGGTYAAERRIGYEALRQAGISETEALRLMQAADDYFNSIGVRLSTPTRIPGNR